MILLKNFSDKCHLLNELLEEKHLFLRVYERRRKFRFLIKKGVIGKNKIIWDLSACVIRKFNNYEISSVKFKHEQKKFLYPIDVVYELTTEGDDLALAYKSHYLRKVKDVISNLAARQCYYCDHFFLLEKMF